MIKPKRIEVESEYEAALALVDTLMDAAPGSPEEEQLKQWAYWIELYENENYPIDTPDPFDLIKFRLEQENRS